MIYPSFLANAVVKEWIAAIKGWIYEFFNPELDGYTNFDFGSGQMLNIRIVIFGIFGGVLLASLYTIYVKNVVGAFVRKLLLEDCLSEDRAKTLSELGFSRNFFVRWALKGSLLASTVMRVNTPQNSVDCREKDAGDTENGVSGDAEAAVEASDADVPSKCPYKMPTDNENTRYYIKEEKKHVAAMRFNANGSGWPTFFFVLLVSVICIFLIFAFLPQILRFLDNTISIFSVAGNTVK